MSRSTSPDITAKNLSGQLSGNLPVYVSPDDITKHPLLSQLLEDLILRLTPTGVHKTTHTQLTQTTQAMMHARQKFLEAATLHRLTTDVLLNTTGNDGDQKVRRDMLEALTLSEVQDHLTLIGPAEDDQAKSTHQGNQHSPPATGKARVFGLNEEDLMLSLDVRVRREQSMRLAGALEVQLEKEWTKIAAFVDPFEFMSYDLDKVMAIVERLQSTKQKLTKEKNQLVHSTFQTDCLSEQVYRQLVEYSKVLHSLARKQRLSSYFSQHLASSLVNLNTHTLRLRCLQLEVLVATYTSQTVPALRSLEGHLTQRGKVAQQNLTRLNHAFASFSGLDSQYQELLHEYAKLQEDIAFAQTFTQV
ncbi:hypothetical protein Pcinc_033021 [Petrolisthes cinctipes]|uniref:HAUS augmin-like complex subunit 4 n=1 Tax=Petrolisthes cinctipes TaxID=88211 RepID=A0AAE1ETF9_PETCI|nr:hypothetical protein Pcinc_033021 [Petrolisthes cinctipes]